MENEDLHKIAPKLSKIEKKNNFEVPDGYFDTFSQRLLERLHPEKQPALLERVMVFIRPHLALATMMAGIFIIAFLGIKLFISEDIHTIDVTSIGMADMLEYELNEMDEISLMEMLAETENVNEQVTSEDDEYVDQAIEYLLNEGVSIETLMQEIELQ